MKNNENIAKANYHLNQGIKLSRAGARAQALPELHDALKYDPQCDMAMYEIGLIHEKNKNYQQAKSWYQKTFELNPGHNKALCNYGSIEMNSRKFTEAIHYFKLALKADPTDAIAVFNLGMIYENRGRINEAIKLYEDSLRNLIPTLRKAGKIVGPLDPDEETINKKLIDSLLGLPEDIKAELYRVGYFDLGNVEAILNKHQRLKRAGMLSKGAQKGCGTTTAMLLLFLLIYFIV